MTYLRIPLKTEPADLLDAQIANLKARVDGWDGKPGGLSYEDMRVATFMLATLMDIAGAVEDSIYRDLLASMFAIPPLEATYATIDATVTMKDAAGYEIPAGTEFKIATSGSDAVGFSSVFAVIVAPGSTVTADGEVQLTALVAGAGGTGLSGTASIVTPIEGPVNPVVLVGESIGGRDAEEDADFLSRGREALQDLNFGLELPPDVERSIRRIAGVERVLVIDNYVPGVNELQDITVTLATGGNFTITHAGQTTGAVDDTATAADVQAALEALSNVSVGDVLCTGGPLMTAPVRVEFDRLLGEQNVATMTTTSSLTGGGAAVAVTTARAGSAADPMTAGSMSICPIDETGLEVSSGVGDDIDEELASRTQQGFEFERLPPTYTPVDVDFAATAYPGFDTAALQEEGIDAVTAALSPANHGTLPFGDQSVWIQKTLVRHGELYAVLNGVAGLDEVTSLVVNGVADGDVVLTGTAPLPTPGDITGTVT